MADWLEEMREARRREDEAAIRKDFARCVADGDITDTDESWRGYVSGWYGIRRFEAAKRERTEAGHGSYMMAMLAWLFGGMMLACLAMFYFFTNHEGLAIDRFPALAVGSVVLIGCGFLLMKRARRLATAAGDKHREEWGASAKIVVDAPEESS